MPSKRTPEWRFARRMLHLELGECARCRRPALPGETLCEKHAAQNRLHALKSMRKRRDHARRIRSIVGVLEANLSETL